MIADTLLHSLHQPKLRLCLRDILDPNLITSGFESRCDPQHHKLLRQRILHCHGELGVVALIINEHVLLLCRADLMSEDALAETSRVHLRIIKTS
jgi:hypothetical protein